MDRSLAVGSCGQWLTAIERTLEDCQEVLIDDAEIQEIVYLTTNFFPPEI